MPEKKKDESSSQKESAPVVVATPKARVRLACASMLRGVLTGDDRWLLRPLRGVFAIRKSIVRDDLKQIIEEIVAPNDSARAEQLGAWVTLVADNDSLFPQEAASTDESKKGGDVDMADASEDKGLETKSEDSEAEEEDVGDLGAAADEVVMYVQLLVTMFLLDRSQFDAAVGCAGDAADFVAARSSRRTLFPISAQVFYFYAVAYERVDRLAEIRPRLLALYKTTSLHHNYNAHPILVNAILRNYLNDDLYDLANKFVSQVEFRDDAPSNQLARFYYYQGRIFALQMEYQRAHDCLLTAIRKSPRAGAVAFRVEVHRVSCVVQLLMGNIPDRATFRQKDLESALVPYLELTQAVRAGDLARFESVLAKYKSDVFSRDRVLTLVERVRNNVLKTGLRKIGLAYSRISFSDIAEKLHLDSADDAEYVAAMAIRDGVLGGVIDHAAGCVRSQESSDVYETPEASSQFHARIELTHNLHNEALRAMRYPPRAKKANVGEGPDEYIDMDELLEELEEEDEF